MCQGHVSFRWRHKKVMQPMGQSITPGQVAFELGTPLCFKQCTPGFTPMSFCQDSLKKKAAELPKTHGTIAMKRTPRSWTKRNLLSNLGEKSPRKKNASNLWLGNHEFWLAALTFFKHLFATFLYLDYKQLPKNLGCSSLSKHLHPAWGSCN